MSPMPCPLTFALNPSWKKSWQQTRQCTSHPGTQELLLLNWHWWSGAQILLSCSLSYLNELSICQIHISLVRVNTDCPLGAVSSNIQRPAAPEPPSAAGSCALQHIHSIYPRGCFHVPSLVSVGAYTPSAPGTVAAGTGQAWGVTGEQLQNVLP